MILFFFLLTATLEHSPSIFISACNVKIKIFYVNNQVVYCSLYRVIRTRESPCNHIGVIQSIMPCLSTGVTI
ncbi:hypothetical protein ALC57_17789 [Trachymyrmex cornetzi]|uniref:SWIM-type domain-containing protein n=1 Tax=Trachymyrmex cornetzi TaxID=471704 RepID=A0A195DCF6_9HYME|nr:hypothetical protein ALC57_17789 [Trachymyrmex cornetzi]